MKTIIITLGALILMFFAMAPAASACYSSCGIYPSMTFLQAENMGFGYGPYYNNFNYGYRGWNNFGGYYPSYGYGYNGFNNNVGISIYTPYGGGMIAFPAPGVARCKAVSCY